MLKKFAVLVLLVWFLVPFVLMTDLYPLFRYGMFAEPVKVSQTTEMLQLWWKDAQNVPQLFQAKHIGLSENHFGYVLRHYFYTHKTLQLFSQIHSTMLKKQHKNINLWQIKQLRISPTRTDTLVVAEWKP
jgi:hypothetical protein